MFIQKIQQTVSHDRDYEIAYLTTSDTGDNETDNGKLNCRVQIHSEKDALNFDQIQQKEKVDNIHNQTSARDSTDFSSLFK